MKRSFMIISALLGIAIVSSAQEESISQVYYKFVNAKEELRMQFKINNIEEAKAFREAFQKINDDLKAVFERADIEKLREDELYYYIIVGKNVYAPQKVYQACQLYLNKFAQGLFKPIVYRELFGQLVNMGRIDEANEVFNKIKAEHAETFFECLVRMAGAEQRQNDQSGAIKIYKNILEEMINQSNYINLPTAIITRSLQGYYNAMEQAGLTNEIVDIFKVALAKLSAQPEIQNQLRTLINKAELGIGKQAPEIEIDAWVNGKGDNLANYRGKVVLLDFWATWCGPCKAAFPDLREIYEKFKDENFIILGLTKYYGRYENQSNLTKDEERNKIIEDFVPKHRLSWPLGIADGDKPFQAYGINAIPTVFLIDKRGIIRLKIVGHRQENKEKLIGLISKLLEEK